MYLVQRYK